MVRTWFEARHSIRTSYAASRSNRRPLLAVDASSENMYSVPGYYSGTGNPISILAGLALIQAC